MNRGPGQPGGESFQVLPGLLEVLDEFALGSGQQVLRGLLAGSVGLLGPEDLNGVVCQLLSQTGCPVEVEPSKPTAVRGRQAEVHDGLRQGFGMGRAPARNGEQLTSGHSLRELATGNQFAHRGRQHFDQRQPVSDPLRAPAEQGSQLQLRKPLHVGKLGYQPGLLQGRRGRARPAHTQIEEGLCGRHHQHLGLDGLLAHPPEHAYSSVSVDEYVLAFTRPGHDRDRRLLPVLGQRSGQLAVGHR